MKPDWDALGDEYADSKTVIIADVDCTTDGKPLCEKYGVRGYPTIKYFNPPDEEGEDYKGGRSLDELKKFAKDNLGPGCSVDAIENCSEEQKTELKKYTEMDAAERTTMLESLKKSLADAEEAHNELLKTLQAQFKESQEGLEKLKEESAPTIKLLKAATPKAATPTGDVKDEM
jgi:protein disulfide-isomerase A6